VEEFTEFLIAHSALAPEAFLLLAAIALLMFSVFTQDQTRTVSWASVGALVIAAGLVIAQPGDSVTLFDRAFIADGFARFMKVLVLLAAALALWLVQAFWSERRRGAAGARMHVRLVAMFSALAVAPTIIVAGFSRVMPRKTRRGRRAHDEILGFREFLERVDRDRLERMGTRTTEVFERLLPYAVVLGVADAWADAFADLYAEPPSWYVGPGYGGSFRPRAFVGDVGQSLHTMGQSLASSPRGSGSSGLGGGGFSGGGFGGGGGGSW